MKLDNVKNIDFLDVIEISSDAQFKGLMDWKNAHRDLVRQGVFALPVAKIRLPNGDSIIYEHLKNGSTNINLLKGDRFPTHVMEWTPVDFPEGHGQATILMSAFPKDVQADIITDITTTVYSIMAYMIHYEHDTKRMTKTSRGGKKKKKSHRSRHKVKLGKYKYTPHFPVESKEETREYNRQAESWQVRGHFRTYKSGKKVWIQPQVRGKKDGKVEPKTYTL